MMNNNWQVVLAGDGGQGLIVGGRMLARAAILEGKNAVQTQSYGIAARGGYSEAQVLISKGEIYSPKCEKPNLILALTQAAYDRYYEQVDKGTVRVTGSQHVPSDQYYIKMEGVRLVGYRTLAIAGIRDPILISQLEQVLAEVRDAVQDNFEDAANYNLQFHAYGINGVMGDLEPTPVPGHEVGLVIDVVAPTQEQANTICSFCRSTLLHFGYPGRISTAGNLALPYSPSDIKAGAVYEFCIHHLLPSHPNFFKPEILEVGK